MPGSGHRSLTNRALVARLDQRDTGRLRVGRGVSELKIGVMDGEIVAASCRDDLRHLLRRLLLDGHIGAGRIDDLLQRDQRGEPVMGDLLDSVSEPVLGALLHDRFIENLTRFLGSSANPRFSHLPAVFDDTFQVGLEADAMLQSCADAWDDAMSVDLAITLFRGASPPRTDAQRAVWDRVGSGAVLSSLLIQLPLEPFTARALIARMLRARVLDTTEAPEPDTLTDELPSHALRAVADLAMADSTRAPAEDWRPESDTPVSVGAILTGEPRPEEVATLSPDDDLPEADEPTLAADYDDEEEEEEEEDDPPTLGSAESPARAGLANLRSPSDWLDHGVEVEEDLAAFDDHDEVRGGADGEDGAFATADHNLDRVEVAGLEPEPLELDEAPSARFSAPVLSERDAQGKVEVAHGVLLTLSAALDAAEGRGRGQSAVQLLFDGSPANFKPLFTNLTAPDDGGLPVAGVLRNLGHRPASEHRRLLNEGLVNLIERYLSVAVEELPDDAIDEVLEDIAGYRQRLGL